MNAGPQKVTHHPCSAEEARAKVSAAVEITTEEQPDAIDTVDEPKSY